jgi:hypothetical protein
LDLLKLDSRSSFADLPDKAKVRLLIAQAEFLSVQRTNPLKDFQRWSLPEYVSTSARAGRPAHRTVWRKETYGEPRESVTVYRSSSPHEGAADGQQRQDPTDRPAHTWRTPHHADSGRRFRRCYCCRLGGMGNNRPFV